MKRILRFCLFKVQEIWNMIKKDWVIYVSCFCLGLSTYFLPTHWQVAIVYTLGGILCVGCMLIRSEIVAWLKDNWRRTGETT